MARSKSLCAKVCEKVCAELTAHLQAAAGIEKGLSGLVVFIQIFGSAANLNIHFHVIALDGVYEKKSTGRLKFYAAQAPKNETIQYLVSHISYKINNILIKKGYLEKVEDMVLVGNTDDIFSESGQHFNEDIHLPAQAASVAHRIAFGPNAGQEDQTPAAWFARAVQLEDDQREIAWKSLHVAPVSIHDLRAGSFGLHTTVLEFEKSILVMYRGTQNPLDYILNALIYRSPGWVHGLPGWIHTGFLSNFGLSWRALRPLIK